MSKFVVFKSLDVPSGDPLDKIVDWSSCPNVTDNFSLGAAGFLDGSCTFKLSVEGSYSGFSLAIVEQAAAVTDALPLRINLNIKY